MQKVLTEKIANEKRSEPRRAKLRNHRIEIKIVGKGAISDTGAVIVIAPFYLG